MNQNRQPLQPITNRMSLGGPGRVSMIPKPKVDTNRLSILPPNRKSSVGIALNNPKTPQTNTRLSLAATSGGRASGVRKSSIYGAGKGNTKQDPRPLTERKFISENIKIIVQYLATHNYDKQISNKALLNPMSKDYYNMLEFLYRRVDPSFTMVNPPEDVPLIFRNLRYPFAISKNSLISVGSPHTWPALLASLVWIIELLNYQEVANNEDDSGFSLQTQDEEIGVTRKQFHEICVKGYIDFMDGNDDFEVWEAEFQAIFDAKAEEMRQEIERSAAHLEALKAEVTELATKPTPLQEFLQKRDIVEHDVRTVQNFLQQLKDGVPNYQRKISELVKELEIREAELAAVLKERETYQEVVNTQELSVTDIEKMNQEKNTLEDQLINISAHKQAIDKAVFEKEIQLAKKCEENEKNIHQFNEFAQRAHLTIPDVLDGADQKFAFNPNAPETSYDLAKNTIKPAIIALTETFSRESVELKDEDLTYQEKIDKTEEQIQDVRDEIAARERQLNKLTQAYKTDKESLKEATRISMLGAEEIAAEIAKETEKTKEHVDRVQKMLDAQKREKEHLKINLDSEKETAMATLSEILDAVLSHKSHIQQSLEHLVANFQQKQQALQNQNLLL
eukprot:TRINITY_DN13163_c0_g1_i1.p1 TRINITY_DN13163_c0_g1~~TRINITY_DN13163_c0_g1_i1.p1  ORF type:complete len:630 (+),score=211.77 TRINITY_DN13163_c0_g1_i1:29-1891(+)